MASPAPPPLADPWPPGAADHIAHFRRRTEIVRAAFKAVTMVMQEGNPLLERHSLRQPDIDIVIHAAGFGDRQETYALVGEQADLAACAYADQENEARKSGNWASKNSYQTRSDLPKEAEGAEAEEGGVAEEAEEGEEGEDAEEGEEAEEARDAGEAEAEEAEEAEAEEAEEAEAEEGDTRGNALAIVLLLGVWWGNWKVHTAL